MDTEADGMRDRPTLRATAMVTLPAVLAIGSVVAGLLQVDTPPGDIARYAAFWLWAVVLPGVLVHRALRGRASMLVIDLALGSAVGIALGLLAWASFTAAGVSHLLWTWPLAVVIPFAALPWLRQHFRFARYAQRSTTTSWVLSATIVYVTARAVTFTMREQPLPPRPNAYYADFYWHMANAAELSRHVPPDVPSVAGRTLRYHWFASAHIAEGHLISGVDIPTVVLRLWELPVVAVVLGLLVALSVQVCRGPMPGLIAGVLMVAPATLIPWTWIRVFDSYALTSASPSQVFGVLALLLAAHGLVDVIRGERLGRAWLVLVLAALLAPGSKPSVVPILVAGLICAAGVLVLRRTSWHGGPLPGIAAAAGLFTLTFLALSPLVAQAASASGFKLFGILYFVPTWTLSSSHDEVPSTGGHIIAGLDSGPAVLLALGLISWMLLQYAWIVAAAPSARRRAWLDPVVLFLAGGFAAGIAAALVVDHAGASQVYFARTGVPFGMLLAGWGVCRGFSTLTPRRAALTAVGGAALGGGASMVLELLAGDTEPARDAWPRAVATPLVGAAVFVVVAVGAWWLARARIRALVGAGAAVFCGAVVVAYAIEGPRTLAEQVAGPSATSAQSKVLPSGVTAAETEAALWVKDHIPRDDLLATNVHCTAKKTTPRCEARSYWLVALSEHRTLVASWADTEENLAQLGTFDGGWGTFPFDDPALFALNEKAFYAPTAAVLGRLRDEHDVRWLFADTLAGPVSPGLSSLADLRFANGHVQVYELRGPR